MNHFQYMDTARTELNNPTERRKCVSIDEPTQRNGDMVAWLGTITADVSAIKAAAYSWASTSCFNVRAGFKPVLDISGAVFSETYTCHVNMIEKYVY